MATDLERFNTYYQLVNRLMAEADNDFLAETARILAVQVAHYQAKHDPIPINETLRLLEMTTIDDAQAKLLADGMECLAATIGIVARV